MDELSQAYVHGQAGLTKINDAMSGDMKGAFIAQAIERATEENPATPPMWQRTRPAGGGGRPGSFRLALLVLAVAVIAVFILANL
jgi:hypothetical protein